ncbi:hypothetical protein E2P63_04985, partial [Candidatus Bathyarchaeota archaeon]
MKEVRNKSARLKTALASKWTARIGTIVFLCLVLFFSNPNSVYGSYFRQIVISLVGWTNSSAWNLIRNVTYVFCLASGLLLITIFLKKTKDSNWRKEVLAINCAWTAFVIQASLMLGLQWEAFDVWITMPNMVEVFFWGTVVLSIASVLLLTPFRWSQWFGYFVTWTTLIGNIIAFFLILNYWLLYSNPFPSLTFVVVITNSLAVYSLNSERLLNSRLISRFKESKGKFYRLKIIFTRPNVFSVVLA